MDWINLQDKQPRNKQQCLTFSKSGMMRIMEYQKKDGAWKHGYCFYYDIAYWMPLPKPPEYDTKAL